MMRLWSPVGIVSSGVEWKRLIMVSASLSAAGLFLIGSTITLFTGRNVWRSGFRQVLFGLIPAAITFGIGRLIGISVAGCTHNPPP